MLSKRLTVLPLNDISFNQASEFSRRLTIIQQYNVSQDKYALQEHLKFNFPSDKQALGKKRHHYIDNSSHSHSNVWAGQHYSPGNIVKRHK